MPGRTCGPDPNSRENLATHSGSFVEIFRSSTPYIEAHRGTTMVTRHRLSRLYHTPALGLPFTISLRTRTVAHHHGYS